jgi:nicotinic acid mononucleotide adenylyltransferase
MELFDYITTTCTSVLKKESFVCIMGIDNIENLHSWAENIHQNQKDTVNMAFIFDINTNLNNKEMS